MHHQLIKLILFSVLVGLAGCDATVEGNQFTKQHQSAPDGAPEGSCWTRRDIPAIIETVTRQVLVRPPRIRSDGTIAKPAVYRSETRQVIVRDREERWLEIVCKDQMDQEFIATLQRALAARGHYIGTINGRHDSNTRRAVKSYQDKFDLDTDKLTLAAAQSLGLITIVLD